MAALASVASSRSRPRPVKLAVHKLTDEELVSRAKKGDNNAFRIIVERHQQNMAKTVSGMLGASSEVDDVVQEVFIRLYRHLDRFRGDAALSTFLKRIAINLSLDALRRRKRFRHRFLSRDDEQMHLPEAEAGGSRVDSFDRKRLIERALGTLGPKHRAVVVLRLIDGYSTREAARILEVPQGTVLSRLSRATAKLRTVLAPILAEEE